MPLPIPRQSTEDLTSLCGIGTGVITQIGVILFFIMVWASVFTKPLILFSGHPLAQSAAILILVQSILLLQPIVHKEQKRAGQLAHASLNFLALTVLVAGVTIVEYNKFASRSPHFHSVHACLGLITLIFLVIQYLVGFTMWATPSLYGGEAHAKFIWKYHRYSGYFVLLLLLATVCSATQTEYNDSVLHIKLWATIVLSVLIVTGIMPRVQKQKLGF